MSQKGLAPILIIILIALGIGGYLIYQKQSKSAVVFQPSSNPVASPLASNQNQAKFVPGKVIVGIKSGVKFKEAEALVRTYNLKYEADKKLDLKSKQEVPYESEDIIGERPFWFTVSVPVGEENEWIEIFSSSSIVKYASLNYLMRIQ